MKLALVISSLSGGGAERIMSVLANAWSERDFDVSLITIGGIGEDPFALSQRVTRTELGMVAPSPDLARAALSNIRRIRALREELRALNPDVAISFMTSTNILAVLAARPLRIPTVVSEHSFPGRDNQALVWRWLRRYSYRRAAAIVALNEPSARWLEHEVGTRGVHVIANPLQVDDDGAMEEIAKGAVQRCVGHKILLAVGRLSWEKGFDLLLHAFAKVDAHRLGWRLVVLGEGPERAALENAACELGIADCTHFAGFSRTPHWLMRRADLFVLSSRYEGLPGALMEAMACGCPCVSFDCPTGPGQLIENDRNGALVPAENVNALADVLSQLMRDGALRERLGIAAREVQTALSMESVLPRWDDLFGSIVPSRECVSPKSRNRTRGVGR